MKIETSFLGNLIAARAADEITDLSTDKLKNKV